MKILVLGELEYFLIEHIKPLSLLKNVTKIHYIRTQPGPALKKITYHCPSKNFKKFLIKDVYKFFLTIYYTIRKKPDIIMAYYLIPHGITAFFIAKIFDKPVSISLIGEDLNVQCKKRFLGKFLIYLLKHSDILTVTGSISKRFLIEKKIDKNKIFISPTRIDVNNFYSIDIPKKYDIIYIGRLDPVKHLEISLKIASQIKEKIKGIKMGIAGSGPLKNYLEQLSIKLDIKNNVDFLGFIDDANHFINSGKIFILNSETEGLPTAMLEAMACGVPCVVSNVGNISDVVNNGENSYIVDDYRDVDSYVNKILLLLKNETIYETISTNALNIRKKYSIENASQMWKKIFIKFHLI